MRQLLFLFFISLCFHCAAQVDDTITANKTTIHQDYRMDILARKESDINTSILKDQSRISHGYRLMILNTNDRSYAMRIRAELLQKYPEQKTYMWFANPYIKIKFGNFKSQDEANPYKKEISKMLNGATVYFLPEAIEVKPDKDFNPDDAQ